MDNGEEKNQADNTTSSDNGNGENTKETPIPQQNEQDSINDGADDEGGDE